MKYLPSIAGALLGLAFVAISATFLLGMVPKQPEPPAGSLPALFNGAFMPSGYMTFVKVLELIGGILVAIPKTRNFGLLVLGPIIVNILAFNIFILKGAMLLNPVLIVICLLALFLLWSGRKNFAALAN